jgi:hypothetical protein
MAQIEPLVVPSVPKLTKKEHELLELLQGNPGRCFSRSYLLQRIWGYRDDTRTRTVDVHVSRLRKKLEDRTDLAIHTVVRQGYVLELLGGAKRPGETSYRSGDDPVSRSTPHVWAN